MTRSVTPPSKGQASRFLHGAWRLARDWWYVAAAAAFLAWVVASANAGTPGRGDAKDFAFVAYQGDEHLGGRESRLANVLQQGKPVILNFWAGQCPPCRAEMPAFQRVADAYAGKVIFMGVDVGMFAGLGSHADAQRLLRDLSIRYPAAYAVDSTPLRDYRVRAMPTTIFFSADGQVVAQVEAMLSEAQLQNTVRRLIAGSS